MCLTFVADRNINSRTFTTALLAFLKLLGSVVLNRGHLVFHWLLSGFEHT